MSINLAWVLDLISKIPHELKILAQKALAITKALEGVLGSGDVAALTKEIPGTWDDKAKENASKWLEGVDKLLQNAGNYFDDPAQQALLKNSLLAKTQSYFTALPDEQSFVNSTADNSPRKESEYDKAAQVVYSKQD